MIVKRINIKHFKLFREEDIEPKGLNVFLGDNKDNGSSNASGKSTLALEPLMFVLYGYTTSKLKDTVSIGAEECSVEVLIEKLGIKYKIIRTIPSKLTIIINGEEQLFVTLTLAQKYINTTFGDVEFFKKFRTLDMQNGINLLDLGNTSLKNLLMSFMQEYFNKIRKSLQDKKQHMNMHHIRNKKSKHIHYYSKKRLQIINNKLNLLKEELLTPREHPENEAREVYGEFKTNESAIKDLTQQLDEFNLSICPTCKRSMPKMVNDFHIRQVKEEIDIAKDRNIELNNYLKILNKGIQQRKDWIDGIHNKIYKAGQLKQNLETAEILKDYKYTDKDIALYNDGIKVLDNFSAMYIEQWLNNLGVIINSLLKEINMSITFNSTKEFMTIQDGSESIKYNQLSTGQKRFLNIIFKLSILMQKNLDGIIVIDEGIDALDITNLKRLLTVFESLPFQVFLISQHKDITSLQDVKYFHILRENNQARVIA